MFHFHHTWYDFKVFLVQFFVSFNKFGLLTSQGSAATYVRCGWNCFMFSVANFTGFLTVEKNEDRLANGGAIASYKSGKIFWDTA